MQLLDQRRGSVASVMSHDVITIPPETPFKKIVERMLDHDISALPIVDRDDRLVGIVTETDLVAKATYRGRRRRGLALLASYAAGSVPSWVERASRLTAGQVMSVGVATAR